MIVGEEYRVTKKIKVHTKPLVEVSVVLQGVFEKETNAYYIFDAFKMRKKMLLKLRGVMSNG